MIVKNGFQFLLWAKKHGYLERFIEYLSVIVRNDGRYRFLSSGTSDGRHLDSSINNVLEKESIMIW
jgi:hypothetical protein